MRKKQGSAQLSRPAGKGYSAFPLPSSNPFPPSLTTLCWSRRALCCLCCRGTWCCLFGVPWPPPQVLAVTRDICLLSVTAQFPSTRCLLCRAAHQKHPGTFHKWLMPLLAGEGCVLPAQPSVCSGGDRVHGTVSHGDGEINVPRHQGDLRVTKAECNLFFRSNRKTKGLVFATFPRKTRVTCWGGWLPQPVKWRGCCWRCSSMSCCTRDKSGEK